MGRKSAMPRDLVISDYEESSNHESSDGHSLATIARTPSGNEEPALARQETRVVKRLRIVTFLVLVVFALLASLGVYLYTRNSEQDAFQTEFESNGLKVLGSFQEDSLRKMEALHSLSTAVTSFVLDPAHNTTWPFVTLENSGRTIDSYLNLADAAAITLLPIVPWHLRAEWETYSVENQGWTHQDLKNQEHQDVGSSLTSSQTISRYIKNHAGVDTSPGPWIVWWQYAPLVDNRFYVNFNRRSDPFFDKSSQVVTRGLVTMSRSFRIEPGLDQTSTKDFAFTDALLQAGGKNGGYAAGEPLTEIYYPVFENFDIDGEGRQVKAILSALTYWRTYFENVLPDRVKGVVVVIRNTAGQAFTYQINGKQAIFLAMEDVHDPSYDSFVLKANYSSFTESEETKSTHGIDTSDMMYMIEIYPSTTMEEIYVTSVPILYAMAMIGIFLMTAGIFTAYDWYVERRQHKVMSSALKTGAVVDSLFPENVRQRLMENNAEDRSSGDFLKSYDASHSLQKKRSLPIADFFPEATIMFADIRGFTAWCSTREPTQVFQLLETIYNAFDKIAKKRKVFKVETVGDCYMAVCGVPTPRKDHAVAMARFARDCTYKFNTLVRKLEQTLGPDTGDLAVRVGLHSGAVTGGVIRGENARFQLFGDTVNTASRMESTGEEGKIQMSQDTVDLLAAAGKRNWFESRGEKVHAKGKGEMQTYWLSLVHDSHAAQSTSGSSGVSESADPSADCDGTNNSASDEDPTESLTTNLNDQKTMRLIGWNVDLLKSLLKRIVARRRATGGKQVENIRLVESMELDSLLSSQTSTPIDEVKEIVTLPGYSTSGDDDAQCTDASGFELDDRVVDQLFSYVRGIASIYHDNPFHSFEHASHVTLSVNKLLSRIIAPTNVDRTVSLHDHTYGITSDPLTHFACVLSALIHDADHCGVPNSQLVKEKTSVAEYYKNTSVAEQNSIDLSWALLMDPQFDDLRATIYSTQTEFRRFRQLLVNSVMATDIVDKDLKALRNARWKRAFDNENEQDVTSSMKSRVDRKATIVIEHLIQASDVAHTMQHWHIYRKWNERFFHECYKAYLHGRAEKDPSENWYAGEIGFFDFYIIPLAKKLKDCGVFGVSSDEYLNYATNNRTEWEAKGREIVAEMVQKIKTELESGLGGD